MLFWHCSTNTVKGKKLAKAVGDSKRVCSLHIVWVAIQMTCIQKQMGFSAIMYRAGQSRREVQERVDEMEPILDSDGKRFSPTIIQTIRNGYTGAPISSIFRVQRQKTVIGDRLFRDRAPLIVSLETNTPMCLPETISSQEAMVCLSFDM
jgi:hypothetical protein